MGRVWSMGLAIAVVGAVAGCSHPSSSPAEPAPTSSADAAPSSTPPSAADARNRLLKIVPPGYPADSCTPTAALGGAVAAVSCGRNLDSGGPPTATYTLFGDAGTLRLSFDNTVQSTSVTDCPGRIQSPGPWRHTANPDKPVGMLLCGTRGDKPTLVWTNDAQLLVGVVQADRNGPTLSQMYSWWSSHS